MMCDLNKKQLKLINDLAITSTPKTTIANTLHCSRTTVYQKLDQMFPRDGSCGAIRVRARPKGTYKATAQTKAIILDYVLRHRFATNKDVIRACRLKTTSEATVSRWLRLIGLGSFIASKRIAVTPVNQVKR